jgi:hypothetical protein
MTGALEKIRQQDRRFFITLASIAILTIVAFIILIAHKARAEVVEGALTDHSHPGLGRPTPAAQTADRPQRQYRPPQYRDRGYNPALVDTGARHLTAAAGLDEETADPDQHRRHAGVPAVGVSGGGDVDEIRGAIRHPHARLRAYFLI